jgi:hypothetical protein
MITGSRRMYHKSLLTQIWDASLKTPRTRDPMKMRGRGSENRDLTECYSVREQYSNFSVG